MSLDKKLRFACGVTTAGIKQAVIPIFDGCLTVLLILAIRADWISDVHQTLRMFFRSYAMTSRYHEQFTV